MASELLEYVLSRVATSDKSVAAIAREAGVKRRWLTYVASGITANPRVLDLEKVAAYFRAQERPKRRERVAA